MRLVAGDIAVSSAPVGPNAERRELQFVDIASVFGKRAVVLVAVVIERARPFGGTVAPERGLEALDVIRHRFWRKRIDHIPRAAGAGALYLHLRTRGIRLRHPRSSETPSRSHGKIDIKIVFASCPCSHVPRVDPFGRKKRTIPFLIPFDAVYWNYMKTAKSFISQFAALIFNAFLIDSRTHPPVINPWLHLLNRLRPPEHIAKARGNNTQTTKN